MSGVKRQKWFNIKYEEVSKIRCALLPWERNLSIYTEALSMKMKEIEICAKQTVHFEPRVNSVHRRSHFHQWNEVRVWKED